MAADTTIPRWAVSYVLAGASALGAALLAVLIYVWNGFGGRLETSEKRGEDHEKRLHTIEVGLPIELREIQRDAERTRRLIEEMARRQGVTVTP
jgi:hypothetical protein